MRVIASLSALAIALLTACTETTPGTATETQNASNPTPLTSTNATTAWHANVNQPAEAWPLNTSPTITSMYSVIRRGADSKNGQTILAFVVWNDTYMGKIFVCEVGNDCADMRASIANIGAQRAYNSSPTLQYSFGWGGNGGGGTPLPPPHPNVDDPIYFGDDMLNAILGDEASSHQNTQNAIQVPYEAGTP